MRKAIYGLLKGISVVLLLAFVAVLVAGCVLSFRGYQMYRDAQQEETLQEKADRILASEDFVPYEELPDFYRQAVICVEDRRFFSHCGIDVLAIARAAWNDLRTLSLAEGGSTITQQLAKNLLFTQEKQLTRKFAEIFAALSLESHYSKEEIFALYVNTISFGNGYQGIGQAAQGYFGKTPDQLNDYECAMLAGLPNAPSVYSPAANPQLAKERTGQVLQSMVRCGVITQEQADRLMHTAGQTEADVEHLVLQPQIPTDRGLSYLLWQFRGASS